VTAAAGHRWRRASLVVALGMGVLLMAMAAPRLVAAVLDAPADRVVFHLRRGADVTDQAFRGLIAARRAASAWHETAQGQRDVAEAELQLFHRGAGLGEFEEAKRAVRRSLARAPVDPHSWARLAHIVWLRDRDARAVSTALLTSIQVGFYAPTLTAWRAALILQLWDAVGADDRRIFAAQIRQLAQDEPSTLAQLAVDLQAARMIDEALEMAGSGPPSNSPPRSARGRHYSP
jgi:hypothetical protein